MTPVAPNQHAGFHTGQHVVIVAGALLARSLVARALQVLSCALMLRQKGAQS